MLKKNLLTILVITYNHRPYFVKAIESILNQKTDFDFKIHILDDCSTDGTSDLVREYAQKYPDKIIPFISEKNIGFVENQYQGIKRVETPYFALLESDDYWCDENKLQLQIDALENNPDCSFCGHDTIVNNPNKCNASIEDGKKLVKDLYKGNLKDKYEMPESCWVHTSSRVFRTDVIKFELLKEKRSIAFDYCLFWYFLDKGKMFYIDKVMSAYNCTGDGWFSGETPDNRVNMTLQAVCCINKELDFKYDKIFFKLIKNLLTKKQIRKTEFKKFFLGKDNAYNYILKKKGLL